jgi:phage terminase Nu1 subunit (DNA packaging protein)
MAKGRGQKVNRTELAAVFGVSLPTVDQWVRDGCPFDQKAVGKGRPWIFDTADVSTWLQGRARDEVQGDGPVEEAKLKRRRVTADTVRAELDLAKELGLVAPVAEFERAQAKVNAVIRQSVMTVPERAVMRLLGETDAIRFKEVLRAELADALSHAANAEIDFSEDEAEA